VYLNLHEQSNLLFLYPDDIVAMRVRGLESIVDGVLEVGEEVEEYSVEGAEGGSTATTNALLSSPPSYGRLLFSAPLSLHPVNVSYCLNTL